jgi:hypothetical protein
MGQSAGYQATNAFNSTFIGTEAGYNATNANSSIFMGFDTGFEATGASQSNFFGDGAGAYATNASNSNFFGRNPGFSATNANNSNFFGSATGYNAINASYSNLFGFNVGNGNILGSIGSNNIIIGTNISLPLGTTNSLNLGGILFGTGTYSTTSGNPSITGQTTGKIGVNVVSPVQAFEVSGGTKIYGGLTANTISATTYFNLPSSSFSGGTVTGPTQFTNGLTANTISATTYVNLPTDIRVTGGTYSSGTAIFTNNTGGTFTVAGFTSPFTGGTVTGATNFTGGLTANTITATTISSSTLTVSGVTFNKLLLEKVGSFAGGSFTGSTKKATITFTTPFADANYAILITGGASRTFTYETQTAGGFVINSNATATFSGNVYWIAKQFGEV